MYVFTNVVIVRVKNASPDMILKAFDVKFHEKQNENPPEVCRPFKKAEKNNVDKADPQKVEKEQCRKSGFIYSYILSYTFIYLQIALYTFIYSHIPPIHQNIEY